MTSFNTMANSLDPASTDDVNAYRAWLAKHAPIEAAEARFLDRKEDLLALAGPRTSAAVRSATAGEREGDNQVDELSLSLPLIAFLPLMVFAIVPTFLGRLFILTLIGIWEVKVVTSGELMGLMPVRDWYLCASG